jgi:hypothetical protein
LDLYHVENTLSIDDHSRYVPKDARAAVDYDTVVEEAVER